MPHIHEKIDFCSEVFVVFKNKVLLRKHDKYNIWLAVGGHIELDGEPNETAVREAKEEVGLDVELYREEGRQPNFNDGDSISLTPPQFMLMHPVNKTHSHIVFIYFAKSQTDQLNLSDTEVSEDCRWFTREEIIKNEIGMLRRIQFYALKALEALSE
jgi:8-oxo-dGTP pyrophosphatase MutT (NUDIX family)